MSFEELTKPSLLIPRRITLLIWLEHHVVIVGFDVLLVADDSIVGLFVKVHISGRAFLGLEMHNSQAICVRSQACDIFERWANDILYTKSTLIQKL